MDVIIRYSNYVSTIKRKQMKHSYKDQINAIQTARRGAVLIVTDESLQTFDEALNDAASTIASLNLNPDIFDRVRDLENQLKVMTSICLLTSDPSDKEVKFEITKAEALLTK